MFRTQIYLDEVQATKLDRKAAKERTTRSAVIRDAIDAALERDEEDFATWKQELDLVLDEIMAGPGVDLPPGEEYVAKLRAQGGERQRMLEEHWTKDGS
jgi:predicted transcriptional regulator